ncbi:hypothetical protein [Tenacibaculum sp. SZ-18]|uniref:hypothetical protein n=1 Tax=Tenacibaculum sp. SZ-18 TaxID=754423 RepID=UPI0012FE6B2B|nr:hypothetical protein [Tenacibaculum sp. SZ-18]
MKSTISIFTFYCFLFLCFFNVQSQNNYDVNKTGYISLSIANSTLPHKSKQQISLYGCNTSIIIDSGKIVSPRYKDGIISVKKQNGFSWNTKNQEVSGIPFGHQKNKSKKKKFKDFYVSKYYISSPPVVKKSKTGNKDNDIYDIGLITPDNFTFDGLNPNQLVYLDYSILKETHIDYIPVHYDDSFDKLNVYLIPFKVESPDFPWRNTRIIKNAKGASGVGALNKKDNINKLFLPYNYINKEKKHLQFNVTILNDILLDHKIFFMVDGKKRETLNLNEYYKKYGKKKIVLKVVRRKKPPCGCLPPKAKKH